MQRGILRRTAIARKRRGVGRTAALKSRVIDQLDNTNQPIALVTLPILIKRLIINTFEEIWRRELALKLRSMFTGGQN